MKKVEVLKRLGNVGVITVLRADPKEEALKISHAVIEGETIGLELTFTILQADEVIWSLVEAYHGEKDIVIGAGTVLDVVTARLTIMAGTEFIMNPSFNREIAEICNPYQVPYLPGCMTITRIQTALKNGVDIVKLFPGSTYGPSIISVFQAPLPYLNIMSAGGASLDNMVLRFEVGAAIAGVGGDLLACAKTGEFDKVTTLTRRHMTKFRKIKEN